MALYTQPCIVGFKKIIKGNNSFSIDYNKCTDFLLLNQF